MIYKSNKFNTNDLRKCKWQYTIRHTTTDDFDIFEIVFLKSNPEFPLMVVNYNDHNVECIPLSSQENITHDYPPEALLHYKHAGLLTYKEKYNISLN